ncbi:MAG: hypothetical protein CEO21_283 [Microgenomates group bacterium Gr01-1014_80]|nr:MAG: hypothetical protein CEO21_283 [Microgenomates group bacterium Gr01-1014_80]
MITFELSYAIGALAVAIFALAIAILAHPGVKKSSKHN